MARTDDLSAGAAGAGRGRHGVLRFPVVGSLGLDTLGDALSWPVERAALAPLALTAAGVYLPSFACGGREDELSVRIRRSKVSREHDGELIDQLVEALVRGLPGLAPELVVSVPERSGEEDRFCVIRAGLAGRIGAADAGHALRQRRVVERYRQLTTRERRACCHGRFAADERVSGRSVLLIDDVVTSGAQASEAVRALRAAGARSVHFTAIAIAAAAPEDARELSRAHGLKTNCRSHTMAS